MIDYSGEPIIKVGITEGKRIDFALHGAFRSEAGADGVERYEPLDTGSYFELRGVTIGRQFHWQRQETQRFRGALVLMPDPDRGGVRFAINEIGVEEYLKSVISSEMSATAGEELLKAHAIMSRSWVLRQIEGASGMAQDEELRQCGRMVVVDGVGEVEEITRWYDRDNHRHFDVCADDHCQRYQGITRQTTPTVERAVEATRGMVLVSGGEIADARFHKCCGGRTELFENCWGSVAHEYLRSVPDRLEGRDGDFCDTADAAVLRQVLNDYDLETPDFYRWEERYGDEELAGIVRRKSGIDFGRILELRVLERGASGRITRLLIRGEKRSAVVGKELEIRRWLSESHLKSSWFDAGRNSSGQWLLRGRGWGHGVGLCQIGAAVMGAEGYSCREILAHYFRGAEIHTIY